MPIRVGMVSLGCSKNLVDSERMLFKLRKHGYTLVKEPGDADVVVVNTCGFIQSAKEEAIETILELAELKKEGTIQKIILTGCLTERYQEEVADQFAEVDAVVGIGDQKDIVSILESVLKKDRVCSEKRCRVDGRSDHYNAAVLFLFKGCRGMQQSLQLLCNSEDSRPIPQRTDGSSAGRSQPACRTWRDRIDCYCTGYHAVRERPVWRIPSAAAAESPL